MRDGDEILGDFVWEESRHGGLGWVTGCAASSDGTMVLAWADVCQVYKKATTADKWTPLIVRGKAPASLIGAYGTVANGAPGMVAGGYDAAFGGTSNTRIYIAIQDRVIVSSDGETFSDTAITGLPIYANSGTRYIGPNGAADPTHADAYYIFMGSHGLRYTLNAGSTMVNPAWCPAPSHPANTEERYGLIAIDPDSSLTSGRHSRIAFAPCGQGIWLSTDGGVTGSNITASSGIEAVTSMEWVNGALLVTVTSKDNPGNIPTENLRKWTSGGGWTTVTTGLDSQCVVNDPRYANGFWLVRPSHDFAHTQNGTDFVTFVGNNANVGTMVQTKPRFRPLVANKYRYEFAMWAVSKPVVAGDWLYIPIGLGVLRTSVTNFPLAGADFGDTHFSSLWPVWEEESAGIEEIVGMSCLWAGDNLWCFGQDIGIALWEDGGRGHTATVHKYPVAQLTDVHGASHGPDENYIVARMVRANQNAYSNFSYTLDGYNWIRMPNQPTLGPSVVWESGHAIAGPTGAALVFPTRHGERPQYTDDLGATAWQNLRFWIGETELLIDFDSGNQFIGFQGADFSNNHHLVVHDNANPGNFYAVNIGATNNQSATSWEFDPLGWAGIYHMADDDLGNFRRIYAGHPAPYANLAYYDAKLLVEDGYLFFKTNYLPLDPYNQTNLVRYHIASDTRIDLTNGPVNCQSITFGAPFPGDTNRCLWALGWTRSPAQEFGLFYSRDLGASFEGPFNVAQPGEGFVKYINAHKSRWGVIGAAINSRGHAIGRYQFTA